MGKTKKPQRVKLVIGMLAKNKKLFGDVEEFFIGKYGEIDYKSPVIPFNYTSYYKKEMGYPLKRRFISFKKLIPPEDISKIKVFTNNLEQRSGLYGQHGRRKINIDPGYVSDSKLVLATTKDYFHRICLKNGIYAEVTLYWRKDSFQPFMWTYPDYKSAEYLNILNKIRAGYMLQRPQQ